MIACNIDGTGLRSISATIAREMAWRMARKKITEKLLTGTSGVSRSRLNAILNGKGAEIHVVTLMRIAHSLETTPDCLLGLAIDMPSSHGTKKTAPPVREVPPTTSD